VIDSHLLKHKSFSQKYVHCCTVNQLWNFKFGNAQDAQNQQGFLYFALRLDWYYLINA